MSALNSPIIRVAELALVVLFLGYATYSNANKVPSLEARISSTETRQAVFEERIGNMDKTLTDIKRILDARLPR